MKNSDLNITLIILGFLELILPTLSLFIIFQFFNLENALSYVSSNTYLAFGFFGLSFLVGFIQILRGTLFKKADPQLSKYLLISGVILGLLAIPAFKVLVLDPIY